MVPKQDSATRTGTTEIRLLKALCTKLWGNSKRDFREHVVISGLGDIRVKKQENFFH